ncbi:MAG: serine hydrolase domain-containing protein, partial [Acidobacteriota bacterium]
MKNVKIISRLFFTFAVMTLLFVAHCFAQDAIAGKVDEFIKSEMQKQRIPGVSLAIVKNGKLIYAKGYGLANVELQVPVKPETVFQSGSVGKQFTATAVMML